MSETLDKVEIMDCLQNVVEDLLDARCVRRKTSLMIERGGDAFQLVIVSVPKVHFDRQVEALYCG